MLLNEFLKKEFINYGIIKEEEASNILLEANKKQVYLFEYLISYLSYPYLPIYNALSSIFELSFKDTLNIYGADSKLVNLYPKSFIFQKRIVPYKIDKDNNIIVFIDNPFMINEVAKLNYFNKGVYLINLIDLNKMDTLLDYIGDKSKREEAIKQIDIDESKTKIINNEDINDYIDAPTVQLADSLLKEAINEKASDIHIEPTENSVRVRFRIDGVLKFHTNIPKSTYPALLTRYKIMANLDISERRIPQDGKITLVDNNIEYDFRVSTLPLVYGEKIVIRLYNSIEEENDLEKLIYDKNDLKMLQAMIDSPHGIVLLTGPTGSGKTTTLYSFLRRLNREGVNITTIEDPVENNIEGINQTQVNYKQGLTFALALRSILRQDPNIIMIGEIRDDETAHIAVQSAITGHLVFSTVHTNDATTTVTRLIDMGVEPYLVADSLIGAVSQRLVRKLCPHCKKEHHLNSHEALILGMNEGDTIYEATGCEICNHTGYQGRIGVFEILRMSDNIRNLIFQRIYDIDRIKEAALKDGFKELYYKAVELVKDGVTSLNEFKEIINISDVLVEKDKNKNQGKTNG